MLVELQTRSRNGVQVVDCKKSRECVLLSGGRLRHEVTAQRRDKGNQKWCSCRATDALNKETGVTDVVP